METSTLITYIVAAIIGWVIFYYIVKAAVKNGIREAHDDIKEVRDDKQYNYYSKVEKPGIPATPEQVKLQERYEKGEISLEVYQSEWNKLKG